MLKVQDHQVMMVTTVQIQFFQLLHPLLVVEAVELLQVRDQEDLVDLLVAELM